jgi:MFS superfamily sulfate permease-like transporter
MPNAVLAAVVFIIGVELIDVAGMKDILRRRPDEFVVAFITAATVVVVGVEQAIILAIIISIIDHLRRSYQPNNGVMSDTPESGWKSGPVKPAARTEDGLVVYRFAADLYYANANRFLEEAGAFITSEPKPRWLCLDAAAVFDLDFTAGRVLEQLLDECDAHDVHFAMAAATDEMLAELERYDLLDRIGREILYSTVDQAVAAFGAATPQPL